MSFIIYLALQILVEDINELMQLPNWTAILCHALREANNCDHFLAQLGHTAPFSLLVTYTGCICIQPSSA